jgi:hypothetical protein
MLAGNAEASIHDKTAPKKPTKVTNKKTGKSTRIQLYRKIK